MTLRKQLAVFVAWASAASQMPAQLPPHIEVERPHAPIFFRSYEGTTVPPVDLKNSGRLHSLLRAGKLYLTVQDAIALAIENNLDLEVDRYGPLAAEWQLRRQQAGGPLRGVTGGNSLVNQVTSGQGVQGSQQAAGLTSGGGSNSSSNTGGAIVSQIGPVTPNLDPVLQNTSLYSHITQPQPNTVQSQTAALVDTHHIFNTVLQQGLLTGGYVQVSADESYLKENAPTNLLNPSVAPVVQVVIRQNFLQGFGVGLNSRYIRIAQKNLGLARDTFRSQLLNLVVRVLNLYWDLVTDNDDLKARQNTLDVAQKFYDDTRQKIGLGVVAKVEIYRAEAELQTRKRELSISQAAVHQQENSLKDAISRNGLEDPLLDAAEIVPLDRIQVPAQDNLPPLRQLLATAMNKRPDLALDRINRETEKISAEGTANNLLPALQGLASATGIGLSGKPNPQPDGTTADAYYVGGLGNALGQIFRRNFPTERAALQIQANIHNRKNQGDYGVDQLQLQQNELVARRNLNLIVVDISNQMIALRQARARYSAAVDTRTLDQELLQKEQQKFALGASTIDDVITAQRSLADAQIAEVAALSIYSHARISLDQVLGETLEKNNVSVEGALAGNATAPAPANAAKNR